MLCLIKCAVAAREARVRWDSPAAAPAARFTLTCAPWCVGVAAFRDRIGVRCLSYFACRLSLSRMVWLLRWSVIRCMLHVACCVVHVASVLRCLMHVACCLLSAAILHAFCDPWSVALMQVGGCNVFCSVVRCMLRLVRCILSVAALPVVSHTHTHTHTSLTHTLSLPLILNPSHTHTHTNTHTHRCYTASQQTLLAVDPYPPST
jgi:hypothetical protein